MAVIDIKVPDIGDFEGIPVIEILVQPGDTVAVESPTYFGLLQVSAKRLFSVTNTLVILLAAGMASQGAGFLVSADILPAWGTVWDSSWLLSDSSIVGKMLRTLIGYTAQPAGIQVVFYLLTLGVILTLSYWSKRTEHKSVGSLSSSS